MIVLGNGLQKFSIILQTKSTDFLYSCVFYKDFLQILLHAGSVTPVTEKQWTE